MGTIVLLHNTRYKKNILQKLTFKWLNPYKIYNAVERKKIYMLEELDKLHLVNIFAGDCPKKFYLQQ